MHTGRSPFSFIHPCSHPYSTQDSSWSLVWPEGHSLRSLPVHCGCFFSSAHFFLLASPRRPSIHPSNCPAGMVIKNITMSISTMPVFIRRCVDMFLFLPEGTHGGKSTSSPQSWCLCFLMRFKSDCPSEAFGRSLLSRWWWFMSCILDFNHSKLCCLISSSATQLHGLEWLCPFKHKILSELDGWRIYVS